LIERVWIGPGSRKEEFCIYLRSPLVHERKDFYLSVYFSKEHSKWTCLSRRMLLTIRSVCTYLRHSGFQGQLTKPGMESSTLFAPDRILSCMADSKPSVPKSSNVHFRDPKPGIINLNNNLLSGTSSVISSISDREAAAKLRRYHASICSMDSGIPRVKLPSTGPNSFRSNLFYASNFDQRASSRYQPPIQ